MINKIDHTDTHTTEILNKIYNLFINLKTNNEQIKFPIFYNNTHKNTTTNNLTIPKTNLNPLFNTIIKHIPPPSNNTKTPLQTLITNLNYNKYINQLNINQIYKNTLHKNKTITIINKKTNKSNSTRPTLHIQKNWNKYTSPKPTQMIYSP